MRAGRETFRAGHAIARGTNREHFHLDAATATQAEVSGIVLFNVMYGIFVSTWVVEKRPDVSVKRVIYDSAWVCFAIFVLFGAMVGAALRGPASRRAGETGAF